MPMVHQLLRNRSNRSYLSFFADGPFGFALAWGVNEPPGCVALRREYGAL
ncbi:hypothetical protein WG66_016573 [Moniliophthora roreri]|nr:hypothetical protein WG66_016573 [Moniliophthora roreri]